MTIKEIGLMKKVFVGYGGGSEGVSGEIPQMIPRAPIGGFTVTITEPLIGPPPGPVQFRV